ncbi:15622_t:CDS:2, partial [Rhizophagus irregularis]
SIAMAYDPKLPIEKTSTDVTVTEEGATFTTKFKAPTFETEMTNEDGNLYINEKVVTSVTVDKENNSQQAFPGSSTESIDNFVHDGTLTSPHS